MIWFWTLNNKEMIHNKVHERNRRIDFWLKENHQDLISLTLISSDDSVIKRCKEEKVCTILIVFQKINNDKIKYIKNVRPIFL